MILHLAGVVVHQDGYRTARLWFLIYTFCIQCIQTCSVMLSPFCQRVHRPDKILRLSVFERWNNCVEHIV